LRGTRDRHFLTGTSGGRCPERAAVSLRRMPSDSPAFVPPPYPHDRLDPIRAPGAGVPGGILDASVGTPVDPMPAVALDALAAAAPAGTGYPATIGSPAFREAAVGWVERRFGVELTVDDVIACIGTKEVVASL